LKEIPQNTHRNNKKGVVYVVQSYLVGRFKTALGGYQVGALVYKMTLVLGIKGEKPCIYILKNKDENPSIKSTRQKRKGVDTT
jgi:hypothetical protein